MRARGNITLWTLLAGLPPAALAAWVVSGSALSQPARWTLIAAVLTWWLVAALTLGAALGRPLRTLASVVRALREGDYVTRARVRAGYPAALEDALVATNELAQMLDQHRLEVVDATALLERVMDEVDVALLGFDEDDRVRLCNRVAADLFAPQLVEGKSAATLGIENWLEGPPGRIVSPPRMLGRRWQLGHAALRQGGRPFRLVVLTDLGKVLHEEARKSAYDVVRVLSHEVRNALTPIGSVAEALATRIPDGDDPEHARLRRNLSMIADRTDGLGRFLSRFAELAKLPPPSLEPVELGAWIERVTALEAATDVVVEPGPVVEVRVDATQLDRALINLVTNAREASGEGGRIVASWALSDDRSAVMVSVTDEGPGLLDTANLFVPFYTTKPNGGGIGLALSREILRAHGGDLRLANREDRDGVCAMMVLPVVANTATSSS